MYWTYTIDIDGQFWNSDGLQFDDPETLKFFLEQLEPMPASNQHGPFVAHCQGEECRFTAEDVPYIILNFEIKNDQVTLIFPGNYREILNPETLFVGEKNVLYCKVREGKCLARFHRKSYLEFTKKIQFDPKTQSYYLPLADKQYRIKGVI